MWSLAMAALTRGEWEPARGFAGQLHARAERDDDQVLWVENATCWASRPTGPGGWTRPAATSRRRWSASGPNAAGPTCCATGRTPSCWSGCAWPTRSGCSDIPVKPTTSATSPCRPRAKSGHAYSRAAAEVWAAIVAIDRGEVAEIRRHARALSACPADESPDQVPRRRPSCSPATWPFLTAERMRA